MTPRSSLPNIMAHMGDAMQAHARTEKAPSQSSYVSYGARSLGANPQEASSHGSHFIAPKPLRAKGVIAQARAQKNFGSEKKDHAHATTSHPSDDMSQEKKDGEKKDGEKKGGEKKDGEKKPQACSFAQHPQRDLPPSLKRTKTWPM